MIYTSEIFAMLLIRGLKINKLRVDIILRSCILKWKKEVKEKFDLIL